MVPLQERLGTGLTESLQDGRHKHIAFWLGIQDYYRIGNELGRPQTEHEGTAAFGCSRPAHLNKDSSDDDYLNMIGISWEMEWKHEKAHICSYRNLATVPWLSAASDLSVLPQCALLRTLYRRLLTSAWCHSAIWRQQRIAVIRTADASRETVWEWDLPSNSWAMLNLENIAKINPAGQLSNQAIVPIWHQKMHLQNLSYTLGLSGSQLCPQARGREVVLVESIRRRLWMTKLWMLNLEAFWSSPSDPEGCP